MRSKGWEGIAELSCRAYATLLPLYPVNIRFEFSEEMLSVFAEQVRCGCQQRGFVGLWHVWYSVVTEIFELTVPFRVDLTQLKVRAASILTSSALFLLFTWITHIAVPCGK